MEEEECGFVDKPLPEKELGKIVTKISVKN
jgi:hypothetical protein